MPMLNLADMFTAAELTNAVNKLPLVPRQLAPLFKNTGVKTTNVPLDLKNGRITLVKNQDRSAPAQKLAGRGNKRSTVVLQCAHLPQSDTILPEDAQDVRGFGTDEPIGVEEVINDRLEALKNNIDATLEFHRLGAVKGVVLDADGSTVLHNLFEVFKVQPKNMVFPIPAAVPVENNPILKTILDAKRYASSKMQSTPVSRFEAIVGSDFYDALTGHELVRRPFEFWQANQAGWGENDFRKRGFVYGGVTWVEYSDEINGKPMVAANEAHMYPVGAGVFETFYAPANWMSTVNTRGREFYGQLTELVGDRGYEVEVQSNPLCICTFPEALVKFTLE